MTIELPEAYQIYRLEPTRTAIPALSDEVMIHDTEVFIAAVNGIAMTNAAAPVPAVVTVVVTEKNAQFPT